MPRATDEFGRFKCCACKRWLPKTEFGRNKTKPGGMTDECKECYRRRGREALKAGKGVPQHLNSKEFIKNWKKYSLRELAAIYGCTQPVITQWAGQLRKLGWDIPHKRGAPPKWDRDEFVRLANSMPISDVADKLGLSYKTVINRIVQCRKEGYDV